MRGNFFYLHKFNSDAFFNLHVQLMFVREKTRRKMIMESLMSPRKGFWYPNLISNPCARSV